MSKALFGVLFICILLLLISAGVLLINYYFNDDDPEIIDDLSEVNLMKLEIKKYLLNVLAQWIKENNLTKDQVVDQLAINYKVVSNIVYQRFDKFTVDRLVDLVFKTGKSLKVEVEFEDKVKQGEKK